MHLKDKRIDCFITFVELDGCSMLNTDAIPMIVFAIVFKFPLCKLLRNGDLGSFDKMSPSNSLAKFSFGFT
jgi:hypothetical protein